MERDRQLDPLCFAYWLQGYFEISKVSSDDSLNGTQVQIIRDHLDLVFNKVTPVRIGLNGADLVKKLEPEIKKSVLDEVNKSVTMKCNNMEEMSFCASSVID
jgi:hypothetical protein